MHLTRQIVRLLTTDNYVYCGLRMCGLRFIQILLYVYQTNAIKRCDQTDDVHHNK